MQQSMLMTGLLKSMISCLWELTEYIGTDAQLTGAVVLGYKAENPTMRPRKSLDEIVEYHM